MHQQQCFVSLAGKRIIDVVLENGRGGYGGKTLAETREQYSDAQVLTFEEAEQRLAQQFVTEPVPITEERFTYMLETLPPQDWHADLDTESFKMSEYTHGDITGIYVRIGDAFWSFQDRQSLSHADCVTKVKGVQA